MNMSTLASSHSLVPQDTYNLFLEMMPIACVDFVLVMDGKALLVNRSDPPAKGQWWVPGGRVIKGEFMRETAVRKAKEEIGIDISVGPIIHTDETIFQDGPYGIPVHSINTCFFVYPVSEDVVPQLDSHHSEYCWINKVGSDLHQYVRHCLIKAGLKE